MYFRQDFFAQHSRWQDTIRPSATDNNFRVRERIFLRVFGSRVYKSYNFETALPEKKYINSFLIARAFREKARRRRNFLISNLWNTRIPLLETAFQKYKPYRKIAISKFNRLKQEFRTVLPACTGSCSTAPKQGWITSGITKKTVARQKRKRNIDVRTVHYVRDKMGIR